MDWFSLSNACSLVQFSFGERENSTEQGGLTFNSERVWSGYGLVFRPLPRLNGVMKVDPTDCGGSVSQII